MTALGTPPTPVLETGAYMVHLQSYAVVPAQCKSSASSRWHRLQAAQAVSRSSDGSCSTMVLARTGCCAMAAMAWRSNRRSLCVGVDPGSQIFVDVTDLAGRSRCDVEFRGGVYGFRAIFLFLQEQIKGIIIVDVTDLAGRSRSKQPVLRQLRFVRQRLAQPSAWRIGFELPQFSAV